MTAFNLDSLNPTTEEINELEETMEFCANENEEMEAEMEMDADDYTTDGFRHFLNQIGQQPLLTAEEEQELFKIYNAGGEAAEAARKKLISSNLRLVVYIAKKYVNNSTKLEDLISMGQFGLMKAIEKFDYTKGFKLSTYATWWINQAVARGMNEDGAVIRIPVHMKENILKITKAQKVLLQTTGKKPSIEEISEYTGVTPNNVLKAIQAMYTVVPMETPVGEDDNCTLEDFIADENAADPYKITEQKSLKVIMREVLNQLEPREALILSLRYGIENDRPMTLEEIAKLPNINLTRERIRQIENKALTKIRRRPSMVEKLKDFVA